MVLVDIPNMIKRIENVGFKLDSNSTLTGPYPRNPDWQYTLYKYVYEGHQASFYVGLTARTRMTVDAIKSYDLKTSTGQDFFFVSYYHMPENRTEDHWDTNQTVVRGLTTAEQIETLLRDLEAGAFMWHDGMESCPEL